MTWATPPNEGRPDIESYDVQYREVGASSWTDGPQDVPRTEAIIRPVDAGKSYDVQVRATNDEGDGPWALWGGDGAVPVTIEARFDSIGGGLEDLDFTLTRQGDTTDELVATVTIVQDQSWLGDSDLEHEVTFEAGKATAPLTIVASKFSFEPSTAGGLTATVSGDGILGGEDTVQIVSTAEPPVTVSLEEAEYTFAETDPAEDTAIYLVATLHRDYPEPPAPARDFGIAVSARVGYGHLQGGLRRAQYDGEFSCRGLRTRRRAIRGPQEHRFRSRGRPGLRGLRRPRRGSRGNSQT